MSSTPAVACATTIASYCPTRSQIPIATSQRFRSPRYWRRWHNAATVARGTGLTRALSRGCGLASAVRDTKSVLRAKTRLAGPIIPGIVDIAVQGYDERDAPGILLPESSLASPGVALCIQSAIRRNGKHRAAGAILRESSVAFPGITVVGKKAMTRHCDCCALRIRGLVAAVAFPAPTIVGIHCISVSRHYDENAALPVAAKSPITVPSIVEECFAQVSVEW